MAARDVEETVAFIAARSVKLLAVWLCVKTQLANSELQSRTTFHHLQGQGRRVRPGFISRSFHVRFTFDFTLHACTTDLVRFFSWFRATITSGALHLPSLLEVQSVLTIEGELENHLITNCQRPHAHDVTFPCKKVPPTKQHPPLPPTGRLNRKGGHRSHQLHLQCNELDTVTSRRPLACPRVIPLPTPPTPKSLPPEDMLSKVLIVLAVLVAFCAFLAQWEGHVFDPAVLQKISKDALAKCVWPRFGMGSAPCARHPGYLPLCPPIANNCRGAPCIRAGTPRTLSWRCVLMPSSPPCERRGLRSQLP